MDVSLVVLKIRAHLAEIETLLSSLDEPPPANVTAIKPEEVELEGIIGRPQLKEVKGKTLFTAGLGVKEGNVTTWVSLEAWGTTAKACDILIKGDRVRAVGKFKENRYLDGNGVMQVKQQFVASLISPVIASDAPAGSAMSR